jgi:hypothetical protein
MSGPSPSQKPSRDLIAARDSLEKANFRKQDAGVFNPDGLTPSAKEDPIGRILLTIPDGRLGVDGYSALQRIYAGGVIRESLLPNFSHLARVEEQAGTNDKQILMIVCGGQTGVDQGALRVAEKLNIKTSGIVPMDRRTALGRLDNKYKVIENHSYDWDDRTQHNFVGADGTLALYKGAELDGTVLTIVGPLRVGRPVFAASLNEPITDELVQLFGEWLKKNNIRCLNVGGPRHSYYDDKPVKGDIQAETEAFLSELLERVELRTKAYQGSLDSESFSPALAQMRESGAGV